MRPRHVFALTLVLGALLTWYTRTHSQAPALDSAIRGGRVIDGTGNPWFLADVGIKGDSIAVVAPHLESAGARIVEAQGMGAWAMPTR
jgi:N-acyl-D-amino-acid deacylase